MGLGQAPQRGSRADGRDQVVATVVDVSSLGIAACQRATNVRTSRGVIGCSDTSVNSSAASQSRSTARTRAR